MNAARIVAGICERYGYTPAVALALPAVQFFTLHREGRAIEAERHNKLMFDLCSVATITFGGGKQYETVVDYFKAQGPYRERINKETPRGYDASTQDAANAIRGFFGGLNG